MSNCFLSIRLVHPKCYCLGLPCSAGLCVPPLTADLWDFSQNPPLWFNKEQMEEIEVLTLTRLTASFLLLSHPSFLISCLLLVGSENGSFSELLLFLYKQTDLNDFMTFWQMCVILCTLLYKYYTFTLIHNVCHVSLLQSYYSFVFVVLWIFCFCCSCYVSFISIISLFSIYHFYVIFLCGIWFIRLLTINILINIFIIFYFELIIF